MRKPCQNKLENEKDCPCDDKNCEYHGICCECIKFHREEDNSLPMCLRKI
jgi:hypothetical protein